VKPHIVARKQTKDTHVLTIVTIYRANMADHFVGAVNGTITEKQKQRLADQYECHRVAEDNEEDDDGWDVIFFRELEMVPSAAKLLRVSNIDGETQKATDR
jgi:hypothetical protein